MVDKQKPRRVAVTLPPEELAQIEAVAERYGLSASAMVRVLVLRALEESSGEVAGVDRVLKSIKEPGRGEAAVVVSLKPKGVKKPRRGRGK